VTLFQISGQDPYWLNAYSVAEYVTARSGYRLAPGLSRASRVTPRPGHVNIRVLEVRAVRWMKPVGQLSTPIRIMPAISVTLHATPDHLPGPGHRPMVPNPLSLSNGNWSYLRGPKSSNLVTGGENLQIIASSDVGSPMCGSLPGPSHRIDTLIGLV